MFRDSNKCLENYFRISVSIVTEELDTDRRSSIRVRAPPGGKSSGFW